MPHISRTSVHSHPSHVIPHSPQSRSQNSSIGSTPPPRILRLKARVAMRPAQLAVQSNLPRLALDLSLSSVAVRVSESQAAHTSSNFYTRVPMLTPTLHLTLVLALDLTLPITLTMTLTLPHPHPSSGCFCAPLLSLSLSLQRRSSLRAAPRISPVWGRGLPSLWLTLLAAFTVPKLLHTSRVTE